MGRHSNKVALVWGEVAMVWGKAAMAWGKAMARRGGEVEAVMAR